MYRIRNVSQAICTAVYNAVVCCTINAIPIAKRFTLSSTKLNCLIFHIIFSFFYSTPFFCALPSLLAYFFLPPIPLCSSISDIFSSILHSFFLSFAFAQEFSSTICARSPSLLIVLYVLRASRALTIVSNHLSPCLCVCLYNPTSSSRSKNGSSTEENFSLSLFPTVCSSVVFD